MNFLRTLLFLLLSISSLTMMAQQPKSTIKGVVLDQASEAPIAYAKVVIKNSDPLIGTTTNEAGEFSFRDLPVGRYDLEISYLAYEVAIMGGIQLVSAKASFLTVYLKESVISLDEVVIRPQEDKESALNPLATVSARQLSMEEANKFAGGFNDPARLVSSFAGVASNLTTNGIVIRGNAPKGLLWRIEGVAVPNPNHFAEISGLGAGGITALSSQMLANSDFITGAFPAEYGNALSGVFDLSMRKGNNEEREHSLQLGVMGIDVSSEGPFKKGGRASYLFNYRYSTFGLIDQILPTENELGIAYQDLSFKLHFPTQKAGVFSLWGLGLIDKSTSKPDRDSTIVLRYYEDLESDESSISMGVAGLTHKYFVGPQTYVKTILSASLNQLDSKAGIFDSTLTVENPLYQIQFDDMDFRFSSFVNHKFGARHSNRSGVIASSLNYAIDMQSANIQGDPLRQKLAEKGNSYLLQAYSQSSISLGQRILLNPGIHVQYFGLTDKLSVEPRLSARMKIDEKQSISLGYGLHSQMEKLNYYLEEIEDAGNTSQPNKSLDFGKSHHIVLGFDRVFGEHTHLKIEPYAQFLFDIPVAPNSYYSFINLDEDFFVNRALVNGGKGRNLGVDITFERFLHDGWYYLLTASVFDSKYQGGDGVWRDTRFNKNYVTNALVGKEWEIGDHNQLNASLKFSYFGGDRLHPVNEAASLLAEDIVHDLSRPFEAQLPDSKILHLTLTYRINKANHSSLWSIQVLNALGSKEHYGYRYNYQDHSIDLNEEVVIIPNISYTIQF